jgi:regulator of sirC expression with transglutaminase-like and TPR domain
LQTNKEIQALLHLLDDPDPVVYATVSEKLISYGPDIADNLESFWMNVPDLAVQERIEELLHRVFFIDIETQIKLWSQKSRPDLFEAMLICTKYKFNQVDINATRKTFKSIYQSTWLELNNYLSPIEQVNILSSIIHNMYKIKSNDLKPQFESSYFMDFVLENKQGNAFTIGAIYLQLCELLDIPIYATNIPNQFILAYYDTVYSFINPLENPVKKILFYIDPINGMVYTESDIEAYLKKIQHDEDVAQHQRILSAKEIMLRYLASLLSCYETNQLITVKQKEIIKLMDIIKDSGIEEEE